MKKIKLGTTITNRDNNSFRQYLSEIKDISPLSVDEEYETSVLAYNGDEVALSKLVKHNLRFVISVAKQYVTSELPLEDLVSEGNMGLIIASKRFEPTKGFKFISYAVWWVRREMLTYISEHSRTIRLPSNKNGLMFKIKNRYEILEQKLGYAPSLNDLSVEFKGEFTDKELNFFLTNKNSNVISMDTTYDNDDDNTSYAETIKSTGENSGMIGADHFVNENDAFYSLNKIIGMLKKPNEREVLTMVFGLDGEKELKLAEIGLKLGITSERVRQIRDEALEKLRLKMSDENL